MISNNAHRGSAERSPIVFWAAVVVLVAGVVLGGATTSGYISDTILQLISVPAFLIGLWFWIGRLMDICPNPPESKQLISQVGQLTFGGVIGGVMTVCVIVIILAQGLPVLGRFGFNDIFSRIHAYGGLSDFDEWMGPSSSIDSVVSLAAVSAVIPSVAVFLLVTLLDVEHRTRFIGWLVLCGMASLILGVFQVMQGPNSFFRFYEISNRWEAIGFFVNRNHFSAFLYTTLIFGICWFVIRGKLVLCSRYLTPEKTIWFAGFFAFILLVFAGIALARSRAGILLTLMACAGVVAMYPTLVSLIKRRAQESRRGRRIVFVILALLLIGVGQMGGERFLHRFDQGVADSTRSLIGRATLDMAVGALPAGTGLGTFPSVYGVYEGEGTLRPSFVNRAHNDWLEFFLETGVFGVLLLSLFLVWFAVSMFNIWIQLSTDEEVSSLILRQGASLVVLLIAIHSFVDYPLRTGAMGVSFAACCALLTPERMNRAISGKSKNVEASTSFDQSS